MSIFDYIYDEFVEDLGKEKIGMATTRDIRDEMVRQVRYIGESLIKNAESIVGTEKYIAEIKISASVDSKQDSLPHIEVNRSFLPERMVE